MDGLTGFPEAINAAFPKTKIQLCIVHMVRHSMKYVPYKDYKSVAGDLKKIYQSVTEDEALQALALRGHSPCVVWASIKEVDNAD